LTSIFFGLSFLAATQDICVDGWALSMLSRYNNLLFIVEIDGFFYVDKTSVGQVHVIQLVKQLDSS
jgi:hypothetical protein